MYKNQGRGARALTAAVVLAAFAVCMPAMAVPTFKTLSYAIHANPDNPESEVVFKIILELQSVEVSGNAVGWEVKQATFVQGARTTGEDPKWTITGPNLNTQDGLWWINHQNADTPVLAEFAIAPPMAGYAAPVSQSTVNLEYSMTSSAYVPPLGGAPFASTAAISHSFRKVDEEEPEEEGDDEPTELTEPNPI